MPRHVRFGSMRVSERWVTKKRERQSAFIRER